MADTRINALTTSTVSVTDDFLPIDGTTAGTKKLSAFSPSFGGSVTVGQTLTVNSNSASTIKGSVTIGDSGADANRVVNIIGAGTARTYGLQLTGLDVLTRNTSTSVTTLTASGTLTLSSSATTVTGTLTVNGTGTSTIAGDLVVPGQGKAINAQGYFLFKGAYCNIFSRGTSGGWGTGLVFHSSNTDPSASIVHDPTTGDLTLYTNATASNYATTDRALLINTSKQVQVLSSTNSTGIASGALLVSGGVGVAGAVYAGGNIEATGGADFTSVAASFARISTVATAPRLTLVRSGSTSNQRAFDIINNQDGLISMRFVNDDLSGSTLVATISYTGDFRISGTLQVGNTYVGGAPTATGYIVIKDSTGNSYKIPAVAL
jgi:hypothetical protein